MMRSYLRKIAVHLPFVIRLILGCLFIWSSLPKIRQPYLFLSTVYGYELVGPKLGMFVAMMLPWLELLVGISLLAGLFIHGALLASAMMGCLFIFVQTSALYKGLEISCGCFRAGSGELVSYISLIRSGLLFVAALAGYMWLLRFRGDQQAPQVMTGGGRS